MLSLAEVLSGLEDSEDEMVRTMMDMVRIPALSPVNGGHGESEKADYIQSQLNGYDSVRRIDVPDPVHPDVTRSNILARKDGKKKGTAWIVTHMDVVPAGDPELWDSPPYEPVHRDSKVYGRGTEDNGQSLVASLFASRAICQCELNGMSMGVAFVADEETGSISGIQHLLNLGCFSGDDVFLVPDWGSDGGSMVEVAEKSIAWLRFSVEGRTAHASNPQSGINAYRVSTMLLTDLMDSFPERFPAVDGKYRPPASTFEPTKRPATVDNVNTIPGHDEFCVDIRLLPDYPVSEVVSFAEERAERCEKVTGARIEVSVIQSSQCGRESSPETGFFKKLSESIEEVTGRAPTAVGVGGGTCANFFRARGMDAYVWQCGGGSLHAPNEHVVVENMMTDAKVFATLLYKMCVG